MGDRLTINSDWVQVVGPAKLEGMGAEMISSLELTDWKSYESATLYVDSLVVLIGTNSSGKSNALDALTFLNRVANGTMLTAALQGDATVPALRGGVEWAARKPGDRFSVGVTFRASEGVDYIYKLEAITEQARCEIYSEQLERVRFRVDSQGSRRTQAGRIKLFWTDTFNPEVPTITARLYNEKGGTPRQLGRANSILFQLMGQKLRTEIQDGVETLVAALRSIFILDPIPSHMRGFSPLADRIDADAGNIAGVLAGLPAQTKSQVEDTLTKFVSRLPERDIARVYAETVGKFNADAMLYCEEHWGEAEKASTVDARGMSDGTLRFLAILTALQTRPEGSLLVIEEVDNGLHPSRSSLLLEVLGELGASRSVDVLVTTHNPALLDAMGTSMVPFITVAHRDPKSGMSRLTLLEDVDELPKLLARGPVGRLSSQGAIENALADEAVAA